MPKDSSGKETVYHLVDLQPSDTEYQQVCTAFKSSISSGRYNLLKSIVKIQRVQNPTLYAQYSHRKAVVEEQNPNIRIEKWLFHGCEESFVKNIYHHGFNKSTADRSCKCWLNNSGVILGLGAEQAEPTDSQQRL